MQYICCRYPQTRSTPRTDGLRPATFFQKVALALTLLRKNGHGQQPEDATFPNPGGFSTDASSVSSPCWSNPSQPPKGRCNERTGSVTLITVGAEWPGTLDIMRNCVISSASLRVTQLDIMLSACLSSSWHPFPLSPYESSAGRGVLLRGHPRPWPVAKPRTLRVPAHKVHGSCLLRHSAADKEDGLAVAGSLQIIFLVFRFRAGSLQLRQSAT